MLSEFWDKYKFHPGLVESGLKDLPKLEVGKFYTFPLQNNHNQTLGSGHTIWECADKANTYGDFRVSYLLLNIGPHDGSLYETFIYGWFFKGNNIILELPEEQQAVMRQLKAAVKNFGHIHLPTDYQLKGYRGAIQSKPGRSL